MSTIDMRIVDRSDNISQVELAGKLDISGVHAVDVKFHGATAARSRPAIVDLGGLEFIASLGVGMLLGCAKSLMRKGHSMVLVNPTGIVEKVLRTVGVYDSLPVAASVDEAVEQLNRADQGPPPPK
jgi:anti-anti-sigma factor